MFRNYLKMALKVLQRRKFYTFISMFGICITLAILLITTALWNHLTSAQAPEVNLDRSLIVSRAQITTTGDGRQISPVSFYFLDKYVKKLRTPVKMSFYSFFSEVNTFVNGKKLTLDQKFTDAAFWEVMHFQFTEGRPYTEEEVKNRLPVAVLSRSVKEKIFGKASALGKEVKVDKDRYRVIGVIEDTPFTRIHSYANLYLPYTMSKGNLYEKQYTGTYVAMLVAKTPAQVADIQQEFDAMVKTVENFEPNRVLTITINADPYLDSLTRMFLGNDNSSGVEIMYSILFTLAFLFMLLPTVNLVNINISRIMERASEIGVRKAFGASSSALVVQFIIENLVLTLLSGLLAVLLAAAALQIINASSLIPHANLVINLKVLGAGLLMTIFFGLMSGVYPAWRMSRLQAAEALKNN